MRKQKQQTLWPEGKVQGGIWKGAEEVRKEAFR